MEFGITTQVVDSERAVVTLTGEVDLSTAPKFKRELTRAIENGATAVIIDMEAATFIDSTALGVLISGLKRLRPRGGHLLLVITDRNIKKVFEIAGLDGVFPIHATRSAALEAVGASQPG